MTRVKFRRTRLAVEWLEAREVPSFAMPRLVADLDLDTDRDNAITAADERAEDRWSRASGAIVLPNLDRDDPAGLAPDNWVGGVWSGSYVPPNDVIDNEADLRDIGRVRLARLGDNLPAGSEVVLTLSAPRADHPFFRRVAAENRVRVFLPTNPAGNDLTPQAGDHAILGPGLSREVRFVDTTSAPNEYPLAMLRGTGNVDFGIEGIESGALVDLRVTVLAGGRVVTTDAVRMRVAPFVFSDHSRLPADGPGTILVEEDNSPGAPAGTPPQNLAQTLSDAFGDRVTVARAGDLWHQDGYEIGYSQAPYGAMLVVLDLPRGLQLTGDGLSAFARTRLLRADLGVNTQATTDPAILADFRRIDQQGEERFEDALAAAFADPDRPRLFPRAATPDELIEFLFDTDLTPEQREFARKHFNTLGISPVERRTTNWYGGALEAIPGRDGRPGTLMYGRNALPSFVRFLKSQDAQPRLAVKTDWLGVGHIDEAVSFGPDGRRVAVADPDTARALLLWANRLDPNARMHQSMNGNDAEGSRVADVVGDARLRKFNRELVANPEKLGGLLRQIRDRTGADLPESVPQAAASNRGRLTLTRGGAFTALLPDGRVHEYQVRFLNSIEYQVFYRPVGGAWRASSVLGNRLRDEVFPDARAFLLSEYWRGAAPRVGDRFTYTADPNARLVRVPVLFGNGRPLGGDRGPGDKAGAYTMNHVNGLSVGDAFVTGKAFGPHVDWSGSGASDLLDDYVAAAFRLVGYARLITADVRAAHHPGGGGSVHCMTNIVRAVPEVKWWG